jgi:methylated-DNA-[protein]-cysteine S-methyltransferase
VVSVVRHRYAVDGWGVGEVVVSDDVVVAHELPDSSLQLEQPSEPLSPLVERLVRRVQAHLGGRRTSYRDIPLELSWCTEFQRELARAIRDVPWGEIVSYGELAALAGRPGAARAAGTFCAHNRYALVFPCHRVVSSTGIGGYGSAGLGLKRRLLALEGIEL